MARKSYWKVVYARVQTSLLFQWLRNLKLSKEEKVLDIDIN
jgi:hypothetical protein